MSHTSPFAAFMEGSKRDVDGSASDETSPAAEKTAPERSMSGPASDSSVPASDMSPPTSDASAPASGVAAPASSSGAVTAVDAEPESRPGAGNERIIAAMRAFLGSKKPGEGPSFIRQIVIRRLYGKKPRLKDIDHDFVNELVQMTALRATECRWPPWTIAGIPGWLARLTKRTIADFFRGKEDDDENLDLDEDVHDWSDRHEPGTDWGARAAWINKWLEPRIGNDPDKVETLRLMQRKELEGYSVEELARELRVSPKALSDRFYRLREELGPKVRLMDREKPRRMILLALIFGGGALFLAGIVLLLWALLFGTPRLAPTATPPPLPVRIVTPAPTGSFDNALPTEPNVDDAGSSKKLNP